ncbi:hypothetical protein [Porphyromonas sp. COT-239 OH1446]|uniref:hypothetical protein n=1 Tax=Porphyromonas sp. COT-239 OH1446 TaxID=1515613 RepID=UPI00052D5FA8|nr:hypothetical protein [Porphyromonas sp. COT-239 OH1446]KGN71261.1 hypothetical protein HQ37_02070 [Porphyromonas sp. COT-239 OH1446]
MKMRLLFTLMIGIMPLTALAQETDSLKTKDLSELVVDAKLQKTSPQSSVVTPTMRQKKSAQNAVDLLRKIAMPQISINLMNDAVTTQTGEGIAIFINFIPASKEDIEGLLTTDVRRVEYLDFPSDPRFQGREHVINFIVRKYEYGGYTKLSVKENFLTGLSSNVSLYSKFAHKKMIYDLYAGASNHNLRNIGASTIGTYSLLDSKGKAAPITRRELFDKAHYKQNAYPITLRAIYDANNIQIANTIGLSYEERPMARTSGTLSYEPSGMDSYSFTRDNPTKQRFVTWNGYYFFALENAMRLIVSPYASYGRVDDRTMYTNTTPGKTLIENIAEENQYRYGISATISKGIAKRQRVFLRGYYGESQHDVKYMGTSPYDNKFISRFAGSTIGYNFSNNRWNISTDISLQWEENKINTKSVKELYPLLNLSAGFSPSSKHSFRTYFHYGSNYPGASIKTPNILKDNELMYVTGNPHIGLSRQFTYNLSYNWIPNNKLSTSIYCQYYGELNLYVPVFEYHDGGRALLRRYDTDAQYHRTQIGASFNYKLLGGKLQLAASPSVTFFRILGYYDMSKRPLNFKASAVYHLDDFYFQAAYQTKFRTIQGNRALYYEDRDFWQLQVGWSKHNFNVRLSANNLFRGDWMTSTETLNSPLYSETRYVEGNNFHRRLNLSITYTFGYGKKVRQNNEVGQQYGSPSAILK